MSIIDTLTDILSDDRVLTGEALADRYNHIWLMHEPLKAKAVTLPKSTEEVSQIMKACHEVGQSVVVFGGLTNLVGSTETQGDEVIISMEKMDKIEEIDSASRSITVQGGVILENIHNAVEKEGLMFPLNFGAKGSARIGGIISTNAGGLRVLRYGMTRQLVLGLEAVLPTGEIISSMKKIIKDNSAYDLKQLFIGSEGTLGVITRAVLRLSEAPKSRNSAFVGCESYEQVVQLLKHMDQGLAGALSGFELIWNNTFQAFTGPHASVKAPMSYDYPYYVLIESLGSDQERDKEVMENLLHAALEQGMAEDAIMAHTQSDLEWFWTIREDVHVMVSLCQNSQHFDISMPISHIGQTIADIQEGLKTVPQYEASYAFGHVADGNIHLVISKTEESAEVKHAINEVVYGPLKALGGSVSAEHGIGTHKKRYLPISRSEEEIALMKVLKKTLDPKNILNPGKVL